MSRSVQVRRGVYQDSVSLMQVSRELQQRTDVQAVIVAMATELNLDLLTAMGFPQPDGASSRDMVVAIEADDDAAVTATIEQLDDALTRRPGAAGNSDADSGAPAPRTVSAAARRDPAASLALISTPGRVAAIDAADALDADLDVMIFSDNVAVEHEVALKQRAGRLGRLVMGPDCGTAVVQGVGLGFANVVRPGPVGVVAASGTGAQHLLSLLDGCGVGVLHCLGVGGRDLSVEVAGLSTLAALGRLAADDDVSIIVLVSKPPADEVADAVTAHAQSLGKPVVLGFLGSGRPDLTATARRVVEAAGATWQEPRRWAPSQPPEHETRPGGRFLRGLFTGGTLCDEAMVIAAETLDTVASNIALRGQPSLTNDLSSDGHTFIDFGDDRLTQGRPHPMIDPSLRLERLRRELGDDECGGVLLDVVLGHGAHPDPASELANVIASASTPVVVSLIGTRDDPQGLDETAARLCDAGAVVHASNAAAAREAVAMLLGTTTLRSRYDD